MVVTVSTRGYIKRQPLATYRRQVRGGKGIIGARTVEEDAVAHLLVAGTHDWVLFFTNRGRVFSSKVHAIPAPAERTSKGIPVINLEGVQLDPGERVLAIITIPNFEKGHNLVMATRSGMIKKTPIEQFERVRSTGIRAITVAENDELAWVGVSSGDDDIVLASAMGRIGRFNEKEVRPMGRDAAGVIGIRLARQGRPRRRHARRDQPNDDILVLTETGYGKRVAPVGVPAQASRQPGRPLIPMEGGKTGPVAAVELVDETAEELLLISKGGQVVRTDVKSVNRYGSSGPRRDRHAPQRG